jgi:hypothetical protein
VIKLCSTDGDVLINPTYVVSVVDNRINAQDHGTRMVVTTKENYEVSQTLEEIHEAIKQHAKESPIRPNQAAGFKTEC